MADLSTGPFGTGATGPTPPRTLYLPSIHAAEPPVEPAAADTTLWAAQLYTLIRNDPGQRRSRLAWDADLARVAALRVADMQFRHWHTHIDPDGNGPNWWIAEHGLRLPGDYDRDRTGNNVESLVNNCDDPAVAWAALRASPPHRAHLLGEGWFGGQQRMGVACGRGYESHNWWLWCVLTLH